MTQKTELRLMPVDPDDRLLELLNVQLQHFFNQHGMIDDLDHPGVRDGLREIYQVLISAAGESHGSPGAYAWWRDCIDAGHDHGVVVFHLLGLYTWWRNHTDPRVPAVSFEEVMENIRATPPVGVMDNTPEPRRTLEEIDGDALRFNELLALLVTPPLPFSEGDRVPYDVRFPQGEKTDESVELSDPPKLQ